jgi:hypothetical protein
MYIQSIYLVYTHTSQVNSYCKMIQCELSLDPEVAILFGREIGQSNGDILLTDCWNLQG